MYIQIAKYAGVFVVGGIATHFVPKVYRKVRGIEELVDVNNVSREEHNLLLRKVEAQVLHLEKIEGLINAIPRGAQAAS